MTMFSRPQTLQLLKPINKTRVLLDGKKHQHVSQQDIIAHLIRMFGFGNFDVEVVSADLIFEHPRDEKGSRFDVCYRAKVRLTVRGEGGSCTYEGVSTATAQNQTRGDAHDLAYKSSVSLSTKRAAIHLGDQFGLSLYNKGQMEALVRGTLVGLEEPDESKDIQEGVPIQHTDGEQVDEPPAEVRRVTAADFTAEAPS